MIIKHCKTCATMRAVGKDGKCTVCKKQLVIVKDNKDGRK